MDENDFLLKIYIGQKINFGRGILYKFKNEPRFNEEEDKIISVLQEKKFINIIYAYSSCRSILTLTTTESGTDLAKKIIKDLLKKDTNLLKELNQTIPSKALGFLLITLDNLTFNKTQDKWIFEWKNYILNRNKMFDFSIKFCQILLKHNLAVLTNDYVSSKGGRIDPEKYVIPNEIREYIIMKLQPIPLSEEEINNSILLYTIYKIKQDILIVKDTDKRRNKLWDLLQVLPFDELAIKSIINKFAEENITTKYSEISNEHFLFSIVDNTRFDIKLNKLVDNFVSEIIKGKEKTTNISLKKTVPLLERHAVLFVLIGNFEIKIRNYLVDEMRAMFKGEDEKDWYNQLESSLYDKLKIREKKEKEEGMLPEDELIYYANIIDYKNIISKNWVMFENKFNKINLSREKFEHGMMELNRIRNKVMHLRQIRPHEEKTLDLYIIPELEKIFL